MPTVREALSYDDYSTEVDKFQKRMRDAGESRRAEFSEERALGEENIRRFVAYADNGTLAGWMVLKVQLEDVKIEGICVDPDNKRGVATLLVARAVNVSFQLGKGGTVTLTNTSHGTGDNFYTYVGFKVTEGQKMRLNISGNDHWRWERGEMTDAEGRPVLSKKGNQLLWTQLAFYK